MKRLLLAAAFLMPLPGLSHAADVMQPAVEPESEWSLTLAPYIWLAGLEGEVAAFGAPEVNIDLSISEVLKHLDAGLMGAAELRNGRLSLATDLLWVKLSASENTPFGIVADKVDIESTMLMLTGVGGYSVIYGDGGNLDVVAGARLWDLEDKLSFSGGNGTLEALSPFKDDATWVDPVVGLKGRANLTPQFYLTGWGLIGGFDVGSHLMWDVMGGLGYEFTETTSMVLGYRALSVDYSNDGFVFDVVQKGPIMAAVFRF